MTDGPTGAYVFDFHGLSQHVSVIVEGALASPRCVHCQGSVGIVIKETESIAI